MFQFALLLFLVRNRSFARSFFVDDSLTSYFTRNTFRMIQRTIQLQDTRFDIGIPNLDFEYYSVFKPVRAANTGGGRSEFFFRGNGLRGV